jgi:hypothetical protein
MWARHRFSTTSTRSRSFDRCAARFADPHPKGWSLWFMKNRFSKIASRK